MIVYKGGQYRCFVVMIIKTIVGETAAVVTQITVAAALTTATDAAVRAVLWVLSVLKVLVV